MQASRMGADPKPQVITKVRLENDTFSFAKKLKVGDKGIMKFAAVVKSHKGAETDNDDETKTIRFTNIEMGSQNARIK